MKFFNSKKKVVLSAVAVLFISVAAFAGDGTKVDDSSFFGKMFGGSCEVVGYKYNCCRHTFWISHSCSLENTDIYGN